MEVRPTIEEVREFCAKHAFKIGTAFTDDTLREWLTAAAIRSKRFEFRGERDCKTWQLCHVCKECCDSPADGPDKTGLLERKKSAALFEEMMARRHL